MLTDDDLSRQLGGAFESSSQDLKYTGRVPQTRQLPSTALITVPAVATIATLVAVGASRNAEDPAGPSASQSESPSVSLPSSSGGETVTDEITVAGFKFVAPEGDYEDDLTEVLDPAPPPADAEALDNGYAKAWVGKDPKTGNSMAWIQSPIRYDGKLIAVTSPTWTVEEMRAFTWTP